MFGFRTRTKAACWACWQITCTMQYITQNSVRILNVWSVIVHSLNRLCILVLILFFALLLIYLLSSFVFLSFLLFVCSSFRSLPLSPFSFFPSPPSLCVCLSLSLFISFVFSFVHSSFLVYFLSYFHQHVLTAYPAEVIAHSYFEHHVADSGLIPIIPSLLGAEVKHFCDVRGNYFRRPVTSASEESTKKKRNVAA